MGGVEEMNFTLIRPARADIDAQLGFVRPAFNGVPNAKYEFAFCCEAVKRKRASFYQLKGEGVNVRFVGYVTDENEYLILAMTGKGMTKAAPTIIDAVKAQGYAAIKLHSIHRGMVRALKPFGFEVITQSEHENVLKLTLEG